MIEPIDAATSAAGFSLDDINGFPAIACLNELNEIDSGLEWLSKQDEQVTDYSVEDVVDALCNPLPAAFMLGDTAEIKLTQEPLEPHAGKARNGKKRSLSAATHRWF